MKSCRTPLVPMCTIRTAKAMELRTGNSARSSWLRRTAAIESPTLATGLQQPSNGMTAGCSHRPAITISGSTVELRGEMYMDLIPVPSWTKRSLSSVAVFRQELAKPNLAWATYHHGIRHIAPGHSQYRSLDSVCTEWASRPTTLRQYMYQFPCSVSD